MTRANSGSPGSFRHAGQHAAGASGGNSLAGLALGPDGVRLSIRWLRVRVPSPSLKNTKDLRQLGTLNGQFLVTIW